MRRADESKRWTLSVRSKGEWIDLPEVEDASRSRSAARSAGGDASSRVDAQDRPLDWVYYQFWNQQSSVNLFYTVK